MDALTKSRAGPFAVMVDTNLPSVPLDDAFRGAIDAAGLQASPYVWTTAKKRSRLHGQCYDNGKCHQTVRAAKDKFVARARDALYLLPLYPKLDDPDTPVTLPKAMWPSDHVCVVANFAPGPTV